jgi:hypothetical protein
MTGNRFGPDTDYNAVVSIYAGPGILFTGVIAAGGILTDGGTNNGASITGIRLDFEPTGRAAVTDLDLTPHIPTPVTGGTPVKQFSVPQYTGTVAWTPQDGEFRINTAYTAAVTLTAVSGYTLSGVGANAFTHSGASSVTNAADSGTVTITFPATTGTAVAVPVNDLDLTPHISAPAAGGTPAASVSTAQYTGNVTWTTAGTAHSGLFQGGTAYRATVTLTAASGYTFSGVGANAFTHGGASSVTNAAGSGTVTITFPAIPGGGSGQPIEIDVGAKW